MIKIGPVGCISVGHVLDVSQKPFERALRDYDPFLYVKWNPKKVKGNGCWEIRRRPEKLSIVDINEWKGAGIIKIGYVENDLINHVLDCAFLNYDQIRKLKSIDTWAHKGGSKGWIDDMERGEDDRHNKMVKRAREESRYVAKQFKNEIRDFKEMVNSGFNPNRIADYWDKS